MIAVLVWKCRKQILWLVRALRAPRRVTYAAGGIRADVCPWCAGGECPNCVGGWT